MDRFLQDYPGKQKKNNYVHNLEQHDGVHAAGARLNTFPVIRDGVSEKIVQKEIDGNRKSPGIR